VLLFAVAAMPIGMLVGTGFSWLVDHAKHNALATSWLLSPAIGLAGLVTGICSIWMPQLPGNGKSIISETLSGGDTLISVAAVMLLKPLLTALFLRAGAAGGMLTPALSTGVATGAFVALAINQLGGHASVPTFGLIGGAAVLGITQHAPVFAAVFTAELTHPPPAVWLMLLLAAVGAHLIHAAFTRPEARKLPAER
jgi:H+/Cl- antiporter ClcA